MRFAHHASRIIHQNNKKLPSGWRNRTLPTHIMTAFQSAIVSNNHGVKLLESNDTSLAMVSFQRGLQFLKECSEGRQEKQTITSSPPNEQTLSQTPSLVIRLQSRHYLSNDQTKIEGFSKQGMFYSYNRPLLLPSNLTSSPQFLDSQQIHLICSVLLFNLALTYQNFRNQSLTRDAMEREAKVYTLALSILEHASCDDDCSKLMMILITNNLAILHFEQCDYEKSHYFFNCMKQLVTSGVAVSDFATSLLTEEEWGELQLNCMFSRIPTAASTA